MLVVTVRSKNESRSFEFDQALVTIGRADVNDVVLPTAKVSKRHARLEATPTGLVLTDLKSTNGTYINGRKVLAPVHVTEQDRVHIGEFVISVQLSAGQPTGPPPTGFTIQAQASADTERDSHATPMHPPPAQQTPPGQPQTPSGESEHPVRRGPAHRMSWLDGWATGRAENGRPHRVPLRESAGLREVGFAFTLHAAMPAVVPGQEQISLRLWADARTATRAEQGLRQRSACALEIYLSLPDGKLEAYPADHGCMQVQLGGQSGDLVLHLRGRETGAARVEIAICHRGARLGTLVLRPEVRQLQSGDSKEPLVQSDIQASLPLETLPQGSGPQAVLRVREYGPIGDHPEKEAAPAPSTSGSHSSEASRRRRLKVEICLIGDETSEPLASGEAPIDVPLGDRVRAMLSTQDLERIGTLTDGGRESALQTLGESLAAALLPPSVRDALWQIQPGTLLQVDCVETWVPWELVRVGRGLTGSYLAERLAMTRAGIGSISSRFEPAPRVLLAPPAVEALVRREQQILAQLDARLQQVRRVADLQALFAQGGIAGLHISGQGGFDRGDKSGASLRLEDGVLTPVQIAPAVRYRKSGQTPPLNGCFVLLSASEPNPPSAPLSPAGTTQWIERFQAAGVGAVLATTWPVSSAKAGQFAEVFYRAFSAGRPLAVAIAEARESIRSEGDPAWLAFAVFGLPGARLGTG
ncbi:MAG: FHA domain-containing protein [Polyangia bacterium]